VAGNRRGVTGRVVFLQSRTAMARPGFSACYVAAEIEALALELLEVRQIPTGTELTVMR
jgi:hypothetical protein